MGSGCWQWVAQLPFACWGDGWADMHRTWGSSAAMAPPHGAPPDVVALGHNGHKGADTRWPVAQHRLGPRAPAHRTRSAGAVCASAAGPSAGTPSHLGGGGGTPALIWSWVQSWVGGSCPK